MKKIATKELFKIWSYVAAHSFGGPAGQIAVIHKLVVEDKKLVSEEKFLHALNFCMLLPGPEAQQLATYMGHLMAGVRGGLIAGGLFILPGFISILALSYIYVLFKDLSFVQGVFYGIKPAIIAIVLSALYKIAKKSLKKTFHWGISVSAFIALFFFNAPFPLVVVIAAFIGITYSKLSKSSNTSDSSNSEIITRPKLSETFLTILKWLCIWFSPILLTFLVFGEGSTLHKLNIFFSKMSLVTFGGAYAALSYVAQEAVNVYSWLQGSEMLDGLALAETTPGPLIQVVQYVGFMGAFRFPDGLNPYFSAFFGSVLTTWMTFAPCFLFIFSFAPYIEFIRGKKIFSDVLSAITAAVVGVIFNLSLWFTLQALFLKSVQIDNGLLDYNLPVLNSVDFYALGVCIIALIMQFKFKKSLFSILGVSVVLGLLANLIFLSN